MGQDGSIATVARREDGVVTLALSGTVTILVVDQVLAAAREAADGGDVIVDLAGVEHIDTACLQVLLGLDRTLQTRSKRMSVTHVPEAVRRFLAISDLARALGCDVPEEVGA